MKKPVRIIAAAAAVLIIIVLLAVSASKQSCQPLSYKIFGSLDEFSCFDNYEKTELSDPEGLTDGLSVRSRRCFSVSFEGYDFNVYAYVFTSAADAEEFAARGGSGDAPGSLYCVSKDNRALLVTGGQTRSRQFLNYLFEHLTVAVDMPAAEA